MGPWMGIARKDCHDQIQIIGAINDARIDERRGFSWHAGIYSVLMRIVNEDSVISRMHEPRVCPGEPVLRARIIFPACNSRSDSGAN